MSAFNIKEYLNSLPENTETINVSNKNLTDIPPLNRFTNLKKLYCDNNQLTQLPQLNSSLEILNCSNNRLTQLPQLNSSLEILNCSNNRLTQLPQLNSYLQDLRCYNNQLTQLPELNSYLQYLFCYNNQLTQLPELNSSLEILKCYNNELPFKLIYKAQLTNIKRNELNCGIQILKRFKELYMLIKFKKHFRNWLWIKVRLPKIQIQFHPDNLKNLLSSVNDEELDEALNNW